MKLHVFLLGIFSSVAIVLAWRSFKVVFVKFPSESNKNIIDVKCQIVNVTEDTAINCRIHLLEQLDDVTLNYDISFEAGERNTTVMVNRTMNFCQFLKSKSIDPMLKNVYEDLSKYGRTFKSCPLAKGIYFFQEYKIDAEMLPSYVPETSLSINIVLTLSNKLTVFKGRLNAKIDKSKGFDNLKMFSLG